MPGFDPDAYLAKTAPATEPERPFNPDVYLGRKSGAVGFAAKPWWEQTAWNIVGAPVSVPETVLNKVTGAAAYPIALAASAGEQLSPFKGPSDRELDFLFPDKNDPARARYIERDADRRAAERRAQVSGALTYQPLTAPGRRLSAAVDQALAGTVGRPLRYVGEKAGDAAAWASEKAGQDKYEQEKWRATADESAQLVAGTLGAKLLGAVGKRARPAVGRLAERFDKAAYEQGQKVLTGNKGTLSVKEQLSPAAVKAAYDSGAIRVFGTLDRAERVLWDLREKLGNDYGKLLTELEARGVRGPNAIRLVEELRKDANRIANVTAESVNPTARLLRQAADEDVAPKVDPRPFADKTLSLEQAEGLKRDYQTAARDAYKRPGETLLGHAQKLRAGKMRQAIEDAVEAQADKAPELAAQFVPLKQKLGPVIEASDAVQMAANRAARNQSFGLGSKIAAGAGLASGNPGMALVGLLGGRALSMRGPATWGSTANLLAKLLRKNPRAIARGAQLVTALEALRDQRAMTPAVPALQFPFALPGAAADPGDEGAR